MVSVKAMLTILVVFSIITALGYAHEWMAPKKEANIKNPIKKDEWNLGFGKSIYTDFCIDCHGVDAKGVDPKTIGLEKRPTNLQKTLKSHSDGDIFWKIQTGRKEMPSFKEDLQDKEIWSVIHYIRSFK